MIVFSFVVVGVVVVGWHAGGNALSARSVGGVGWGL